MLDAIFSALVARLVAICTAAAKADHALVAAEGGSR